MKSPELDLAELTPMYEEIRALMVASDRPKIIEMLYSWVGNGSTRLPHPHINLASGSSRSSHYERNANIIFFSDNSTNNRFAIIQMYCAIDAVWCEEGWFYLAPSNYSKARCQNISTRLNNGAYDHFFNEKLSEAAFFVHQPRPAHFLFDQLTNIVRLIESHKPVKLVEEDVFLRLPEDIYEQFISAPRAASNEVILWLPTSVIADKYYRPLWRYFVPKSTTSSRAEVSASSGTRIIRIWFGGSSMKRRWMEQLDACELIVEALERRGYETIELMIDGVTSPLNNTLESENEFSFYQAVRERLNSRVTVISLIGATYHEKIEQGRGCTGFICASGTPSIIPNLALKLPGVIHSNEHYWYEEDVSYNHRATYVDFEQVTTLNDNDRKSDYLDYSIDPRYVARLFLDQIETRLIPE